MRMFHYFAIAATITSLALLAAAGLGLASRVSPGIDSQTHFLVSLIAAILAIGTHTILILFMILTGRILREAIRARDLPQSFLEELNHFFAKKAAYPAAISAAFSVVVAGVMAFAGREFGFVGVGPCRHGFRRPGHQPGSPTPRATDPALQPILGRSRGPGTRPHRRATRPSGNSAGGRSTRLGLHRTRCLDRGHQRLDALGLLGRGRTPRRFRSRQLAPLDRGFGTGLDRRPAGPAGQANREELISAGFQRFDPLLDVPVIAPKDLDLTQQGELLIGILGLFELGVEFVGPVDVVP